MGKTKWNARFEEINGIEMCFQENGWEDVEWMKLAQGSLQ